MSCQHDVQLPHVLLNHGRRVRHLEQSVSATQTHAVFHCGAPRPARLELARVLEAAGAAYAIIGGIAVQMHQDEPRTTLDIAVAVRDRSAIPTAALKAAGFQQTGSFTHSENWVGPGSTPVQFTDDPHLRDAFARTISVLLEDVVLRVLGAEDLLHAKLRAAADPARRRSKRFQDLADAQGLVERQPALGGPCPSRSARFSMAQQGSSRSRKRLTCSSAGRSRFSAGETRPSVGRSRLSAGDTRSTDRRSRLSTGGTCPTDGR